MPEMPVDVGKKPAGLQSVVLNCWKLPIGLHSDSFPFGYTPRHLALKRDHQLMPYPKATLAGYDISEEGIGCALLPHLPITLPPPGFHFVN